MPSSSACSVKTWPWRRLRVRSSSAWCTLSARDAVDADQLVQRRQRRRQLRAAAAAALRSAARTASCRACRRHSGSPSSSSSVERRIVHLPAGGAVHLRRPPNISRKRSHARCICSRVQAASRRRRSPASGCGRSSACRPRSRRRARAHDRARRAGRCPGPAAACRTAACAGRSARAPRCATPCPKKPGRNTRRIARPVWSGPRLNRKVAPAPARFSALDQRRHALARAAQRVDVDLQRELHGTALHRARHRLLRAMLVSRCGLGDLAAVGVEDLPQRLAASSRSAPAQVGAGVVDLRHAVLHVLVALAVVLGRGGLDQLAPWRRWSRYSG